MVPGSRQVGADYVAVTILAPVSPLVVAEAAAPASPVATGSTHSGFDHRCRCSSEGFVALAHSCAAVETPLGRFKKQSLYSRSILIPFAHAVSLISSAAFSARHWGRVWREIPRAPSVTRQVERASFAVGQLKLDLSHCSSRKKAIEPGLPRVKGRIR